jgi:hypothetical protein
MSENCPGQYPNSNCIRQNFFLQSWNDVNEEFPTALAFTSRLSVPARSVGCQPMVTTPPRRCPEREVPHSRYSKRQELRASAWHAPRRPQQDNSPRVVSVDINSTCVPLRNRPSKSPTSKSLNDLPRKRTMCISRIHVIILRRNAEKKGKLCVQIWSCSQHFLAQLPVMERMIDSCISAPESPQS